MKTVVVEGLTTTVDVEIAELLVPVREAAELVGDTLEEGTVEEEESEEVEEGAASETDKGISKGKPEEAEFSFLPSPSAQTTTHVSTSTSMEDETHEHMLMLVFRKIGIQSVVAFPSTRTLPRKADASALMAKVRSCRPI
jgi:hypothetical protein